MLSILHLIYMHILFKKKYICICINFHGNKDAHINKKSKSDNGHQNNILVTKRKNSIM